MIVKFAIALSLLVGLKMGTVSMITRSLWLLSSKQLSGCRDASKNGNKIKSVCYQFVIDWFQVGNYMETVIQQLTVINCKSVAV